MFAAKTRRKLSLLLMGALLIAYLTPVRAEVILQGSSTPLPGPAIMVNGNVGQTRGSNLFHSFSVFNILRAGPSASGLVVPAQESVTFTSPTTSGGTPIPITNVINRVTGGTSTFTLQKSSLIDGGLNSSIPGANFWFINPNGIIFGSNAVLPTTGSFHASTADYIKLADGSIFAATPFSSEVLTVAPPSAFGFLTANPAGIQVVNAVFQGTPNVMQVPAGRTLSLVGGTINVGTGNSAQGFLLAPAGRLNLVSVASAGEATFDPTKINGPLTTGPDSFKTREINVDNFTKLGDINIRGAATGNAATSLVDAKEIFIRSGSLTVDNSLVVPGVFTELGLATGLANSPANGGRVEVRAAGDVTITGNRSIFGLDSGIQTRAGGPPATTNPLTTLRDVPDISVEAGGTLTVSGFNAIVRSERFVQGTSSPVSFGNIDIKADRVQVLGGGEISAINHFSGKGGDLTVNASEIVLDGVDTSQVLLTGGFTGLTTQSNFHPGYPTNSTDTRLTNGQAGTLTVNADTLTIKRGANITADNFDFGKAGDIVINVRDLFLSRDGATTGSISTQSTLAGDAGNITIRASDRIELNDGQISATTNSSGKGGFVDVAAGQSLSISGANGGIISLTAPPPTAALDAFAARLSPLFQRRFGVATPNFAALVAAIEKQGVDLPDNAGWLDVLGALNKPPFSVTAVANLTPGNGGQISVTTPSLVMNAGTRIDSSTLWDGNAGQIVGNFGNMTLNDGAQIRSQSGGVAVASGQPSVGFGNGGSVTLTADDSILITGSNSAVSTNTFGNGNAGNVSLSANQVNVQNAGSVTSESGGTLAGQLLVGIGDAGTVNIAGTDISVSGTGSTVSTSTLGNGNGGDVSLTAGRSVNIVNGGLVSADSLGGSGLAGNINITAGNQITMTDGSVSTRAVTADGGNITLNAPNLIQLTNSQVTTSVESGFGGGGNITIDPRALILTNSKVLANAFGGPGGNINIIADVFLVNSGGQFPTSLTGIVDASSALSTPGTVNIEATFTNVVGNFTQLPSTPLQATELLRAACAARFSGGKASSLVVGGRDGLPLQPGDLLPSPLYLASDAQTPSNGTTISGYDQFLHLSLLEPKDSRFSRYRLLPNAKCSL
jgi:filamentous hemagglutinin family protein